VLFRQNPEFLTQHILPHALYAKFNTIPTLRKGLVDTLTWVRIRVSCGISPRILSPNVNIRCGYPKNRHQLGTLFTCAAQRQLSYNALGCIHRQILQFGNSRSPISRFSDKTRLLAIRLFQLFCAPYRFAGISTSSCSPLHLGNSSCPQKI
jgi:hypothetical protein